MEAQRQSNNTTKTFISLPPNKLSCNLGSGLHMMYIPLHRVVFRGHAAAKKKKKKGNGQPQSAGPLEVDETLSRGHGCHHVDTDTFTSACLLIRPKSEDHSGLFQ